MSSFLSIATLLAVSAIILPTIIFANQDEDFAFEITEDFDEEFDNNNRASSSRRMWDNKEFTASVGKAFNLVIPFGTFPKDTKSYEAKTIDGHPLPFWLLFDKIDGVFWGLPLIEDVGTYKIIIKSIGSLVETDLSEELILNVVETADLAVCSTNEDSTILTLLIDKGVRAIKPKQRIIAINNLAQFFGLPYSAFTLKPQLEKDDITDSSVVLAGPGNLLSRSSKLTSLLQVPVGCDGRLWIRTAPLIHQLKSQARDGTISEVIRLPLIGWRVKTETRPILRTKRQTLEDYGSGDYEYYDENYDDEYEEEDGPGQEATPKVLTTPSTTPSTTTTTTNSLLTSQMHPHRHHHGEAKSVDELEGEASRKQHPSLSPRIVDETTDEVRPTSTTSTSSTTTTTTTTTTSTTTTTPKPSTTTTVQAKTTAQAVDENEEYDDYWDNEDEDEDPIESKTIIPDFVGIKQIPLETTTKIIEISTITTSSGGGGGGSNTAKLPTTIKEVVFETTLPVTTTTQQTTPIIIEDTEPSVGGVTEANIVTEPVPTTISGSYTSTSTNPIPTITTISSAVLPTTNVTTTTSTTTTTSATPITTITLATTTDEEEEEEDQDLEDTSTVKQTTIRHIISSTPRTTTIREVTEEIDYGTRNFQPYIENRIKQMSVIAGKIFRFVVPKNTFKDFEDGYNLTIEFLNSKGEALGKNSWCHFNPIRREIYGLPLEDDVSKWEYVLKASDKDGASVSDRFTIQVQQHKSQRVVNHEFSLLIRIEKQQEFHHYVDWCLKTLRALGRIYNSNMSEITVRHVNYTNEPVVFTWTNDSIPTNYCPKDEIKQLFDILTANNRGDPSRELNLALAPELRVKKVMRHYLSICEGEEEEEERPTPITPPTNFPPFLRNPVDHINATVGELLVFRVPDDTFYDPEDVDSRLLNISLMTSDRQPIPANNWLQFDSKNREFYGIPRKVGRSEYQLVCVDSAGLPATDSLELVVYPAPKIHYNVEFSMTIETPFEHFVNSASMQKKFVEKLKEIFGDRNTSYIHLNPFKQKHDSTIVTWYNKSLSTVKCPHDEISRLEAMMKSHDRGISSSVHSIMDPEFPVSTIKVLPIGNCKTKPIPAAPPAPEDRVPVDESTPESSSDEYLITFIVPAVIISIMLFLASIAACVLYRRRRTGKMNVEEDGRQSYGNKGIPVIFQEELEEKPEAGTKTPVILKDEKPPLAPPEYSKSGSLKLTDDSTEPYQPPPPFTRTQDNGRQPRPKPTPTYRKPPPYVPP